MSELFWLKGSTGVEIELEGDLAALLRLATGSETVIQTRRSAHSGEARPQDVDIIGELVLVAGAGNRRNLPTLSAAV